MDLFLGVDGGQSSTIAVIGDETGRVAGWGAGGPCNHVTGPEGREKFVHALTESVGAACARAGVSLAAVEFRAACFGLSGGAEDKRALIAELVRTRDVVLEIDAVVALAGATGGEPGIITIAGTGSIAFGRNAAGKTARAGGWGYVFGDEGGGFDLARQGLRAALRYEEGWGPKTMLHALYLEAAGAKSANEVLHKFYSTDFSRPRIASFGRFVGKAALEADAVANGILLKAAAQLAALASAVRRQLFEPGAAVRVAHMGGAFQSALLREQFRLLVEQEQGNICGPPLYAPAAGALLEAYRAAGLKPQLSNIPDIKK